MLLTWLLGLEQKLLFVITANGSLLIRLVSKIIGYNNLLIIIIIHSWNINRCVIILNPSRMITVTEKGCEDGEYHISRLLVGLVVLSIPQKYLYAHGV